MALVASKARSQHESLTRHHRGALIRVVAGLTVIGLGLWAVLTDVPRWNAVWYVPAWYGYLLVLDGLLSFFGRPSFLTDRRREFAAMLFWSVPFWFVFEAYNLVIHNWYYVFVLRSDVAQSVITGLAFATVLPACFLHAELLAGLGCWQQTRWRRLAIGRGVAGFVGGFGALCIVLPVVCPRYAFWMVWGAALGVPEIVNYRSGAPSLLADLEAGRPTRLLRLLVGGMIAGLAWEALNFPSRCKWIYTVPGLEHWKLFEMPLPGFIGFPFLALEAFALYSLVSHRLRGGRNWELHDRQPHAPIRRGHYAVAATAAVVFSLMTFAAVLEVTAHARRPVLRELSALSAIEAERLTLFGIATPEKLYAAFQTDGVTRLAEQTGLDPLALEQAALQAGLALHKGMGADSARLLWRAGVRDTSDLTGKDASTLWEHLSRLARELGLPPPSLAEVEVWIRAARADGSPSR